MIKHLKCNSINKQSMNNHLIGSRGCRICLESKGEKEVSMLLNQLNINYNREHIFEGCRNIRCLRFDFYLTEYNVCIEYDGKQHFEPIKYFGGEESFNSLKIRDSIKGYYCQSNGIELIRFNYKQSKELVEMELKLLIFDSD